MGVVAPPWDWVAEFTKTAAAEGREPAEWVAHVAVVPAAELSYSPELAQLLASYVCAKSDTPLIWKYAERAIANGLASPLLFLSLLSVRLIPNRFVRPTGYRLYLELLLRHGFYFETQIKGPNFNRTIVLADEILNLSKIFGFKSSEPGIFVVEYVLYILWQLVDTALDDEGLLELTGEDKPPFATSAEGMYSEQRTEKNEKLRKLNTLITVDIIARFLHQRVISRLIVLARENMPTQWGTFVNHLSLLATNSSALRNSSKSFELIQKWMKENNTESYQDSKFKFMHHQEFYTVFSTLWIPIDLYLEDCIDGSVAATNSIEILTGLVKSLQAINHSTWHDAFLALWIASLRLVQREREPVEGPVPRLDTRLCMLLSITTLSVADIIQEEESIKNQANNDLRRKDLISSLQSLGDFESLLVPPPSVISMANQAALKAVFFVSGINVSNVYMDNFNLHERGINFSGNLRHLIVESCISRNLLDTSAYYWPDYMNGRINQIPHPIPSQLPSWSTFMRDSPLTQSMVYVLVATPAPSLAEIKKIFEIVINGSEDDRVSAASVLCGATLIRGWNTQEHTVRLVVKLLSPPVPVDYSGKENHLINHGPIINAVLTGISSVDCVQVFSFHGLIPELAAALMEICEIFGSCFPTVSWKLKTGEELSAHSVFSNAFILLMRLWKFNHPPLEYCILGEAAPVGSQLTPEYLLLLRNSHFNNQNNNNNNNKNNNQSVGPIFVDSFPKLKIWYRQHQACLASTLSGLAHGTPVHKNVDSLLNMMFRKINRGGSVLSGNSSLSSSSCTAGGDKPTGGDDTCNWPVMPAWEVLEAVPFVVDAALTACSHGRLSPRELATGLKDLADYLPASLATIVSYFSAEVTRGVWKPAFMNGSDWPSPATNLSMVEDQIKKIVAATGVNVPSLVAGKSSLATLPLPLAAFVSLTITYKLDKASERFLNLAGPALESLAASCPWPSMPIVAALWTQKVKKWTDFLIFSASRTVFHHNNDAVVQLLHSCFTATLGLGLGFHATSLTSKGGVGSLLGHGFGSPVAPGILYLRIFRCIKDCAIIAEEILSLLMLSVKEIAETVKCTTYCSKKTKTRYGQASLSCAMTQVKLAAALGATIIWLSGGSGLVQSLIQEMLPSWFLSARDLDKEGKSGGIVYKLGGHALAYLAVYSGMLAWGIAPTPVSNRRQRVMQAHFEFLASALDGKITLGCDRDLWNSYVSGFLGLVVECAPRWVLEVRLDGLKRVSRGLMTLLNEDGLALSLLRQGGPKAVGAAAELILASG